MVQEALAVARASSIQLFSEKRCGRLTIYLAGTFPARSNTKPDNLPNGSVFKAKYQCPAA